MEDTSIDSFTIAFLFTYTDFFAESDRGEVASVQVEISPAKTPFFITLGKTNSFHLLPVARLLEPWWLDVCCPFIKEQCGDECDNPQGN